MALTVTLSREELIDLVKSVSPSYDERARDLERVGAGIMMGGGMNDPTWHWRRGFLEKLPEQNLYDLYRLLKTKD